jgi:hypothetical protein
MASKIKLIAISKDDYENLRKFGEFGESLNDIITKILDEIDAMRKEDVYFLLVKYIEALFRRKWNQLPQHICKSRRL